MLNSKLSAIERNLALYQEANFDQRSDALDFIDFHFTQDVPQIDANTKAMMLRQRAETLKNRLEDIDVKLFEKLRNAIRNSNDPKDTFNNIVRKYFNEADLIGQNITSVGYDNLDIFINRLLGELTLPTPVLSCDNEMVFFQKTPARIAFQMAIQGRIKPGDVFFDIGSGLGQVVMLINLITGARAIGVEYEPAYCAYAIQCAQELNLNKVEVINAHAHHVDYTDGNIFFLYTPFKGEMLQTMLNMLQVEAGKRPLRLFTYGPCSVAVSKQKWLVNKTGDPENADQLCEFLAT